MLSNDNCMKTEEKRGGKSKKGVIVIMSIAVIVIIMISINKINNNSGSDNHRELLELNIDPTYPDFYTGSKSLSCYNNESSANYGGSTKNVTCSKAGYTLTGCSGVQGGYMSDRYGVYSDGNYCFGKHISNGKENQYDLIIQARCCKANKGTLNVEYSSNNAININECNTATCSNANKIAIGSSIMLDDNDYSVEFQGSYYVTNINGLSGIKSYGGNNADMKMGLFCGQVMASTTKTYDLQCVSQFGTSVRGYGVSSVNCTSDYKLTACDSLHRPFLCAADNTPSYLSGSYTYGSTCWSEGNNVTAVARCCTIV